MFSRVGSLGEPAEQLDTLGRIRREQVDAQTAGTHQHQPARPVGVVQRKPDGGAAAQRIAHQRSTFDAEVVEQVQQGGGAVAVVLLMLGVFVGVPVTGLIHRQDAELLREHADVAAEVRPTRRPRSAAVQQHHRWCVGVAGFVVVQPHVVADLRIARGGFERDCRSGCSHRFAS